MADAGRDDLKVETFELAPGIWELKIAGSLDGTKVGKVDAAIDQVFAKGTYTLVVNLKEMTYVSSDGLGCFISSYVTSIKQGGRMVFMGASLDVREVFDLVGLTQILRFADNEETALRHLREK